MTSDPDIWHVSTCHFPGQSLWLPDQNIPFRLWMNTITIIMHVCWWSSSRKTQISQPPTCSKDKYHQILIIYTSVWPSTNQN